MTTNLTVCLASLAVVLTVASAAGAAPPAKDAYRLNGPYVVSGDGTVMTQAYESGPFDQVAGSAGVTAAIEADGQGHALVTLYSDASDGRGIVGWVTSKSCVYTENDVVDRGPQTGTFQCEFETPTMVPFLYGKYVIDRSGEIVRFVGGLYVRQKVAGGWRLASISHLTLRFEPAAL